MTPREQARFRILRLLEQNPELTQRQLAEELGLSLGKVNYLLNALVEKGQVKIAAFRRSGDKLNKVVYHITPKGLQFRMIQTRAYLERKTAEYEALRSELAELRLEVAGNVDAARDYDLHA